MRNWARQALSAVLTQFSLFIILGLILGLYTEISEAIFWGVADIGKCPMLTGI